MKKSIIVISIIILTIVLVMFINKGKNKNLENQLNDENLYFNEETTEYEVYDDEGNLLISTPYKDTAEFYLEHPDYEITEEEDSTYMRNVDEYGNFITFETTVSETEETPFE